MKIKWMIIVVAISSLLLSSCMTTGDKKGTLIGGLAGALAAGGSCAAAVDGKYKIWAAVGCAIAGGGIGAWLGNKWDKKDQKKAENFLNTSPSNGKAKSWTNPDTKNKFKMTALKASTNNDGQKCRQFKLVMNGEPPKDGKACRNKRGGWDFQDV
jgi:surface antigen